MKQQSLWNWIAFLMYTEKETAESNTETFVRKEASLRLPEILSTKPMGQNITIF